jgi:hypothetical protein
MLDAISMHLVGRQIYIVADFIDEGGNLAGHDDKSMEITK